MIAMPSTPVIALVVFVAGLISGWQIESWRWQASERDDAVEAKEKYVSAVERSEKAALKLSEELNRLEKKKSILTKEIYRETQKVEYRCPLPESGRVLYLRAAQGDSTVAGDLQNKLRKSGASSGADDGTAK